MGVRSVLLPWESQPQEGTPTLRDEFANASACFLPSVGPFDLACGKPWSTFGTAPAMGIGRPGVAADTTAAFGGRTLVTQRNLATAEQTHILCVESVSVSGVYAGLFSVGNAAASAGSYGVQRNSGNDSWRVWNASAPTNSIGLATAFGPSVMAVTGSAAGTDVWVDGVLNLSESVAPTTRSDSRIVLFGEWSASTTYATKGRIWFYVGLPYRLSRAQLADLTRGGPGELWQKVFKPQRIIVPVAAAGGGTSLTLADASHAHAADNIILTTATTLAVADCTHGHTADSPALVVGSVLTVAEASHAHAADALTLTTASTLAVSEATHAHAADAVALTTDSTLALADALHGHAADNVVLEVAGATNLTVEDATHAHTVDALALTSAHALIVADATHGHTVDGLTLTAASVLAIQEALHAHAADGITLDASGAPTLLLADALHAHTSDGVALTVAAWLAVSDALHGHAADNVVLSIPGAFVSGNPRVWLLDARRHYTAVDARNRVAHLS